jgi:hypothetical protein
MRQAIILNTKKMHVSKREFIIISLWSLLIAFFFLLPYLLAYYFTPSDAFFLGHFYQIQDHSNYFSWLQQAMDGKIFMQNFFTSIPHERAVINVYFLVVGTLGRFFGLSLDATYQLGRLLSSWFLCIAAYYFAALFFQGKKRVLCWVAVLLSSGIKWIAQIFCLIKIISPTGSFFSFESFWDLFDRGMVDSFPFLSLLFVPLFSVAIGWIFFTLRFAWLGIANQRLSDCFIAALLIGIVNFIHPYDVFLITGIIIAQQVILSLSFPKLWLQWFKYSWFIIIIGILPAFYNYWIMTHNPGLIGWCEQNFNWPKSLVTYILALGIPLIFSFLWLAMPSVKKFTFFAASCLFLIIAHHLSLKVWFLDYIIILLLLWQYKCFRLQDQKFSPSLILVAWLLIVPLLLYSPLKFSGRMHIALEAPLVISMLLLLDDYSIKKHWSNRKNTIVFLVLISLSSISFFIDYPYTIMRAIFPDTYWNIYWHAPDEFLHYGYRSREEIRALQILSTYQNHGAVLSSNRQARSTGNLVPRFTRMASVHAAFHQTENYQKTEQEVRTFYSGIQNTEERRIFLKEKRVSYIIYGPDEQMLDVNKSLPEWLKEEGWEELSETRESLYHIYRKASL